MIHHNIVPNSVFYDGNGSLLHQSSGLWKNHSYLLHCNVANPIPATNYNWGEINVHPSVLYVVALQCFHCISHHHIPKIPNHFHFFGFTSCHDFHQDLPLRCSRQSGSGSRSGAVVRVGALRAPGIGIHAFALVNSWRNVLTEIRTLAVQHWQISISENVKAWKQLTTFHSGPWHDQKAWQRILNIGK